MPTSSKKIAKNTLYLYCRMLLVTAVSLYTSRVTLDVLGLTNYGIYTVVGGLVGLMSALATVMAGATQRFITYAIGANNSDEIQSVFLTSVQIHISSALILIIAGETIGLFYFYNYLNIPFKSQISGLWVLQCSILSIALSITQIPYNSVLISYERMNVFAAFSILEVILKLSVVFILYIFPANVVLIWYAILTLCSQLILRIVIQIYVLSNFNLSLKKITRLNISLFKKMANFAGWSFLGTLSYISLNQAIPIIVNMFAGVIANAAVGISNQVSAVASQFVTNFQTAFKPQIVKCYAEQKYDEEISLFYVASKFSFFILLIVVFPMTNEMEYILHLWLNNVPTDTAIFCKLILLYILIDTLTIPILTMIEATGKIKHYYIWVSSLFLMFIPLSYLCLKIGYPIYSIFIVKIILSVVIHAVRLKILSVQYLNFSWKNYGKRVIYPILRVIVIPIAITMYIRLQISSFGEFLLYSSFLLAIATGSIYAFGLNNAEKHLVRTRTQLIFTKWKK